ncbi:MAG: serine/threonine protein kinase, partial [Planctomycetales bacterium]|nr:serine/threonine protein kinase [Planctomycetales bacterium]
MKPNDNSLSFVRDDASLESSVIRDLTDAQKQRLTDLLDQYMVGLEQDKPLDPETLCAAHPDLADALRSYLSHLEALHEIAAGFAGAAHDSLPVDPGSVAWESESDAARRLGDFRLGREIGRGGMGVVYEAQQISLDRRVALKVLPFAAVLDAKQIARFKNEAQAAAQVHHPNIVPVFAVGVERGVHYYAMQLIDGQPLDRAIRQLAANHDDDRSKADVRAELELAALNATRGDAGATTVASQPYLIRKAVSRRTYMSTVAQLGIQAAEALHAAHEYGVVHRDIKPSNLLVDDQGKLWVTDFGLARCHTDGSLTRSGDMLGTLRYMS